MSFTSTPPLASSAPDGAEAPPQALVAGLAAVLLASGVALPQPAAAAATTASDQPVAPPPAW